MNSPLKQPLQNQQNQQNKDGGPGPALNGRKQSMSQGLTSPSGVPRPATRRRETTDTNPFSGGLTSPTSAGPGRQFDAPWFNRKAVDAKESESQDEERQSAPGQDPAARPAGFAGLARSSTAGATGFTTSASSVWGAATVTPTAPAFGGFGNFALNSPGADKGFASSSASSRFFSKKDSSENIGGAVATVPTATTNATQSWRSRPRTDTDPFGGDEGALSGSAALGGARDTSPPPMPTTHGSQLFDTPVKGNTSDFGMSGLNLGGHRDRNASSASPSQTNPYRSPPGERGDNDHDDLGFDKGHPLGGQSEQNSTFGSIRGFPAAAAAGFEGSDRSQTSSVGAKNYPALGNLGGWPSAFTGTPDRERAGFSGAFGSSVFSPMTSEIQSPGLGGMGGLFGSANGGLGGSVRGGSKLGSLFPAAMQAQMQNPEHDSLADSIPDTRQSNPLNVIGAGAIGPQSRDTDSPLPMGRSVLDIIAASQSQVNSPGVFTTAEHNQNLLATAPQGHAFGVAVQGAPFGTDPPATGPPQGQNRIMVMPDRMRWMYMDPQGQQQGPFTGLEMNEWYKGNFFNNDLRVRKLEDHEFEPLGQLIRRIGNSREPFLVPQVGVPHGPPPQTGTFSPGGDSRGVIPPLVGVVPSYGKTLTAEEQNNLERRKQEEQVAMARQREYLAQQSHFRPMHPGVPGVPGVLQHQASIHSLQSQPSFGSITSPIGMPPQAPIGASMGGPTPTPGFFDQANPINKGPALANVMNAGPDQLRGDFSEHERQMMANPHGPGGVSGMFPPQPVGPPTADLKSQLPSFDQLERDPQGFKDRLKEFQDYQGIPSQQPTDEEAQPGPSQTGRTREQADAAVAASWPDAAPSNKDKESAQQQQEDEEDEEREEQEDQSAHQEHTLSLTEQVQQTQADAAHAAHRRAQEDEAKAKQSATTGLPMPFPAPMPPANTHIAAPTAQRRANIADQYLDTRSQSQTPDSAAPGSATATQPPPLAPWARDPVIESQKKGPSLKEIQEAEAVRAAQEEAQRRAQQEQDALAAREREKTNPNPAAVPGLPQHSTWGSGSPAPSASSPWAKPAAVKTGAAAALPVLPKNKTLADIQREEEARKARLAKEQAASSGMAASITSMGKRYADLAGKTGGPPGIPSAAAAAVAAAAGAAAGVTPAASGWSTVGAGGKVKAPMGPQARSVSASTVRAPATPPVVKQPVVAAAAANRPAAATPPTSTRSVNTVSDAHTALATWLKAQLSRGVKPKISLDVVVMATMDMGTEKELIESTFYQALADDSSVDPRNLAGEYIRRKKQAEKGVFEPAPVSEAKSGAGSGGWSEVAKKGGSSSSQQPKDADVVGAGFKVVPRKKGKK